MPHFIASSMTLPTKRVLVTVRRCHPRTEEMMEMDGVATDLISANRRPRPLESRDVERLDGRSAEMLERHVADIDVRSRDEERVAASPGGVLRTDHHIAAQIADVRKELEPAVRIARPGM